jgi:Bacterial transcriptional activator domain
MTARAARRARTGRRSFADVLAGLAAVVVLCGLLAGVPLALVAAFGSPVPHTLPSLSVLTHRLDLSAVIKVCSVVVWLAWLQLVWCTAAEVTAAVRNTGMPARVPLAGGMQALAHRLVTSALLLTTATTLSPALAASSTPTVASASLLPGQPGHGGAPGLVGTGGAAAAAGKTGQGGGALLARPAPAAALPGTGTAPARAIASIPAPAGRPMDAVDLLAAASAPAAAGQREGPAAAGDLVAAGRTEKIYVVQPPEGRFHESLWEIAERHLGNGRRYREIFDLNAGRRQPDGSELTIASLIRPGWVLLMPHDAHGPGIKVITPGHERRGPGHGGGTSHAGAGNGHGQRQENGRAGGGHAGNGQGAQGNGGRSQAAHGNGGQQPHGSHGHGGQQPQGSHWNGGQPQRMHPPARQPGVPPTPPPGTPVPAAHVPSPPHTQTPSQLRAELRFPAELAGAGLLAAGALAALAKLRRRQRVRRGYGRRVAMPGPEAAWAEAALRLGADDGNAGRADAGLRYLCRALARQDHAPPTVYAAHIGEENLDLWVAPAGLSAPEPWFAVGDGQVWRLPLAAVPGLLADLGGVPAPYPGLVTIGTDATGRVLVDVSSAPGLISLTGPRQRVEDALAAMATELATSRWSEGTRLTLVGFGADLAVLAPGRVRLVPTLAEALDGLEDWAAEPGEDGAGGAEAGPHYLITAVPPDSDAEAGRLLEFARGGHPAQVACVAAGDVPGAAWTWEITPDGRLLAGQLGLEVAAQAIPHEQQVAVAELFEAAGELTGAELSAPLTDVAPAEHLDRQVHLPVEVTLLGPVSVRAPGHIDPARLPLATEIVVYLATHPGGVHPGALSSAIWPRGVTAGTRDAALDLVREWLGSDGIGRPHLAADATGRLRLGSGVRVDWQVFRTLITLAGQAAEQGNGAGGHRGGAHAMGAGREEHEQLEATLLTEALSLITGPFLAGAPADGYCWLAVDGLEYEVEARAADAAHRLAGLHLAAGDADAAMAAVRAGLRAAPCDELLWRDLIIAAHATGDEELLRSVTGEICEWARVDDRPPALAAETEDLLDELLPGWRWPVT